MPSSLRQSFRTGLSFGWTSGIITTLGLMVGLHSGTHSPGVVLGGILTIAIADALSDALGIHLAEETRASNTSRHIWEATAATFVSKFVVAMSFAIPVLLMPLDTAVVVSIVWGLALVALLSVALARAHGVAPWKVVAEHVVISLLVIVLSFLVGAWVGQTFGQFGDDFPVSTSLS